MRSFSRDSSYERISLGEDDEEMLSSLEDIQVEGSLQPQEHTGDDPASGNGIAVFEIGTLDDEEEEAVIVNLESQQADHHSHTNGMASPKGPPSSYICPLTLHLMNDPVSDGCGHCFEREAIIEWLEYHELCPISRKPLHYQELIPHTSLNERIRQWKSNHPGHENDTFDDATSVSTNRTSHSPMELMLLPQERQVLSIIKLRARDRKTREEYTRCLWIIAGVISLFLIVATCLALKYLDIELQGPI